MIGYADDSTVYVKTRSYETLKAELEELANIMINYCNKNNLVINTQKTQILTNTKEKITVKIG